LLDLLDCVCQTGERIPPRIDRSLVASTGGAVQILTTAGAKSFAVRRAERTSWQGEQHLLTHDILKQKTAFFIIPDFCLVHRNCAFSGFGIGGLGTEDKVEVAIHGDGNGFDAAGAEDLEVAIEGGTEADIVDVVVVAAVFDEQIGAALDGEGADLADVDGVVDHPGSDGLLDKERLFFEIDGGYQHRYQGKEIAREGQMGAGLGEISLMLSALGAASRLPSSPST
jgi:hypothetical protein